MQQLFKLDNGSVLVISMVFAVRAPDGARGTWTAQAASGHVVPLTPPEADRLRLVMEDYWKEDEND